MTRFARAKGSKASNERTPDDGTPWEVMKEQLLNAKKESDEAKKRQEAENQRIQNYEHFLKEQKVQKRKATWCDFPEAENRTKQNEESPVKKKKKNKQKLANENGKTDDSVGEGSTKNNAVSQEISDGQLRKQKKKKNNKQTELPPETQSNQNNKSELPLAADKLHSKKKNKKNKQKDNLSESVSNTVQVNNKTSNADNNNEKMANTTSKKNKKKLVNGQPARRKAINDQSFQLIINGKEVELIRYDGFPIMKKDAERLKDLKNNMINRGIPKSEIQRTMKLERRRAEKALARVKRDVCYNCRKGGHNLSDCPDLKSKIPGGEGAEGICFKCGSTEHRQFECKVQRDKEFRFANCFICKEQGHIARQCPDNPKGLYPNGGSCKLCGDVTHLRKDCPTVNDKKEETSVKLQTLDSSENIEDIQPKEKSTNSEESYKKPKKIKF